MSKGTPGWGVRVVFSAVTSMLMASSVGVCSLADDDLVAADPGQKQAVADCLNLLDCNSDGSRLFLMRGAFGTGKTRTLAEIAFQATAYAGHTEDTPFKPILCCAEANGAADKICEILGPKFQGNNDRLFRFNALHRNYHSVSEVALRHSSWDSSIGSRGLFRIPRKDEFMSKYDIVVTTYSNAAVLFGLVRLFVRPPHLRAPPPPSQRLALFPVLRHPTWLYAC